VISMSASDVVRRLIKRDVTSHESLHALDELLRSPCYGYFLKTLKEPDVLRYVNFLDKTLNSIPTTDKLWKNCLNALQQVCGDRATLPTAYVLSRGLVKREKASIPHDTEDFWKAQCKRRAVRVRSLQMPCVSDQAFVKKFCHEATLWRRLNHENVTSVFGVTMNPYQVVFDRVSDKDIAQCTLDVGVNRANLVSDVAEGLEYLHSQNVIHGRLRGAAILVNDRGRAVLTDFGSNSVVWNPEDIPKQIIRWCAPEVLGSEKVSGTPPTYASDVFSLGMVVLEIFSGKAPFDGVSDSEVVGKVRSGERPNRPAGSKKLGLSDALWETIRICWNGSPELRPGVAGILEHTRRSRPTSAAGYSETSTLLNPNPSLGAKRWRGFSNLMCGLLGLQRVKREHTDVGLRVER